MKQFTNLKAWLKNNDVHFEKGYSYLDNNKIHDFVILPSDIKIYNDQTELVLCYDNDDGIENIFKSYENNKDLYKEIKNQI